MMKKRLLHQHSRPFSINVLMGYVFFLLLFYLFYFVLELKSPATILFGKVITGNAALLIDAAVMGVLLMIFLGLVKKRSWTFYLSLLWFGGGIINAIFSLAFLQSGLYFLVKDLIVLSFISVILVNGLILWYIVYRKEYFMHGPLSYEGKDKFFVYSLVSFWVIILLLGLAIGMRYYNYTTSTTKSLLSEVYNQDLSSSIDLCNSKQGYEKDLCFVVLAVSNGANITDADWFCSNVETNFYKITCLRAVGSAK